MRRRLSWILLLATITAAFLIPPPNQGAVEAASRPGLVAGSIRSLTVAGEEIVFVAGTLAATIESPTSLAFGPDGRLYVATLSFSGPAEILALTLDPATQEVLDVELIATDLSYVLGIAFDPTAPPSPVVLYASRQEPAATDGFEGVVSRFTAPNWEREDLITGLPTSAPNFNHYTNGLAFDATGRLLIAQGSSTEAGLTAGVFWPETPLSAAILIAAIHAPGFDGAISYSPAGPPADDNVDQVGGDVQVYASGIRNAYDLVVHSNGRIYATDNGKGLEEASSSCTSSADDPSRADELNLIEEGNYYGHPNRNRGRFDPRQCVYHAPEEGSGAGYTGPIAVLPDHCSCDGIAEYTSAAFGGAMQGDLLYVHWNVGNVWRAQLADAGSAVLEPVMLASGLSAPLDVTVGPNGTIYVAELAGGQISYLAPDSDRDGCADGRELGSSVSFGGQRDPKSFWDFFDPTRDGVVSILDFFALLARFGAVGDPTVDPLSDPPEQGYHPRYDRGGLIGPDPWNLAPADGAIAITDFFALLAQFGHVCV